MSLGELLHLCLQPLVFGLCSRATNVFPSVSMDVQQPSARNMWRVRSLY